MDCPVCGKETRTGYITPGGRRICWVPEGERIPVTVFQHRKEIQLSEFPFRAKGGFSAFICEGLRRIVGKY